MAVSTQPHISALMAEEVGRREQNQKAIYISASLLCFSLILYHLQNSCHRAMSFVAAMAASWPGTGRSASAQTALRWARTAAAAEVGLYSVKGYWGYANTWHIEGNPGGCVTLFGAFGLCSLVLPFKENLTENQYNVMLTLSSSYDETCLFWWAVSFPVWQCPHPQDKNTHWMI